MSNQSGDPPLMSQICHVAPESVKGPTLAMTVPDVCQQNKHVFKYVYHHK